jgi:hypothetical protein
LCPPVMPRTAFPLVLALAACAASAWSETVRPDLSGLWTSASLTELERHPGLKTLTLSDAEAAAFEARRPAEFMAEGSRDDVAARAANEGWWDLPRKLARIDGKARSSWIVDPPDGRLPYSAAGLAARTRAYAADSANPETRQPAERCLIAAWGASGPPMLNAPYSNLYQIVQTKDAVAILMEANHDVRIIRLNDTSHPPSHIRPWMGDSIGRWDGATLVVETTNLNPGDGVKGPTRIYISERARITERFTRVEKDRLLYEFDVDDPATFTRTWRAQMVFTPAEGPLLEYACHEGNYALPGILAGARREEADSRAAAAATK